MVVLRGLAVTSPPSAMSVGPCGGSPSGRTAKLLHGSRNSSIPSRNRNCAPPAHNGSAPTRLLTAFLGGGFGGWADLFRVESSHVVVGCQPGVVVPAGARKAER